MAKHGFPIDFSMLQTGTAPRFFLVLPAGFASTATAHMQFDPVAESPESLLARFRTIALAAPRTRLRKETGLQIELQQQTAVLRFTDIITAGAFAMPDGKAALAIYSHAQVGYYDFGVNRKRITGWLEQL